MIKARKKIVILILLFILLLLFLPVIYKISEKLSTTERTDANILLVEGWLPPYALKMAYNEFKNNGYDRIITTGLRSTPDYFNVYTNGFLIFYTLKILQNDNAKAIHSIEIKAFSSLGGENRSHFNVLINDSIANNFYADRRKRKYIVTWRGKLSDIDSVSIEFLNDRVGDFGDRNLFIKEITFNHKITVPYQLNSIYTYSEPDLNIKIENDYLSYAQFAKNRLLAMGIDSSLIVDIPGKNVSLNRTLTSALAFRNWLKTSDIKVDGINIISVGAHSRRTWMTYNKILRETYDIGIISLPDYRSQYSRRYKVFKTVRETIGIIYYWFILIPY